MSKDTNQLLPGFHFVLLQYGMDVLQADQLSFHVAGNEVGGGRGHFQNDPFPADTYDMRFPGGKAGQFGRQLRSLSQQDDCRTVHPFDVSGHFCHQFILVWRMEGLHHVIVMQTVCQLPHHPQLLYLHVIEMDSRS